MHKKSIQKSTYRPFLIFFIKMPPENIIKKSNCQQEPFFWLIPTSNRSLLASISTASCSSPKELTQAVPPQEAVLTLKAVVLNASPMHIINLISALSGVAFVRNSSYKQDKTYSKLLFYIQIISDSRSQSKHQQNFTMLTYTRLSPISHLVTSEEFFVFETFNDDLGTTLSDSPNSELDLRLCHAFRTTLY